MRMRCVLVLSELYMFSELPWVQEQYTEQIGIFRSYDAESSTNITELKWVRMRYARQIPASSSSSSSSLLSFLFVQRRWRC